MTNLISCAQNYEDIRLRGALHDVERGFYVDAGANDPVDDSVTKLFYDAGWRGINIEPVKKWYERLTKERPRDINLDLAVGASEGECEFFELVDTGLSTMDDAIARRHVEEHGYELIQHTIPVTTLTTVCQRHAPRDIHFLKIDVEGAEGAALQGLDLNRIRPWIIVMEATWPNSQVASHEGWETRLTNNGYQFVYFDGLSRFYVAEEHRELSDSLQVPPDESCQRAVRHHPQDGGHAVRP